MARSAARVWEREREKSATGAGDMGRTYVPFTTDPDMNWRPVEEVKVTRPSLNRMVHPFSTRRLMEIRFAAKSGVWYANTKLRSYFSGLPRVIRNWLIC